MKTYLFVLPVLTCAVVVVAGCRSGSHQPGTHAAAIPEATAVAPQVAAAPVAANPLPTAIRIKAGASAMKDSAGNEWLGDAGLEGGDVIERPDLPIANTQQPEIYRSEHYSMGSFAYPLPNGKYQVRLHFCETYEGISGPGERVFSFDVEGRTFKDFDVWTKAGGFAKAYVESVDVTIADGRLDIKFTPNLENPQINGIEIIPTL